MKASWIRLGAQITVLAFVAAACGGDDGDDDATSRSNSDSSSTTSSDDVLGTPNPATGDPIKIGLITEEGGAAGGAQGAETNRAFAIGAAYINEYMGGIGGRPIEVWECGNQATPAGAQDCAQQAVEQEVVAVVLPFDCCGDDQVPIVVGAGIPYVVASGAAPSHLGTSGAFSLTGGYFSLLAAVAKHASEQGTTTVTHVVIDVPAAVGAAQDLGEMVFGNAGVDYELVPVAPGTPDMTPQLSAAGDSALFVTGDITFCTSFNQAYDTLGLTNPKYLLPTCIDPSVLESLPQAFDGALLPTFLTNEGDDAELYAAIIERFGDDSIDPDPIRSGTIASPLSHIINFARMMDGLTGDVTADAVMARMRAAEAVPLFLSGGVTATCDATAIPLFPNVCSSGTLMATLDATASPTEIVPVEGLSELFTPPAG